MLRDKLLLLICLLLLTDLLIDPVASRGKGRKRNRKGNKRRNRNRTAAPTRPPPPTSPAIQPRSVSGFFANFFGDVLPTTGSITIPGTDTALTWNLPTGEIGTEMVATGGGFFPPTGVLTTNEEGEVDEELFEREWRGKGSFTGDVRIHCIESGCNRGVVQIYNREERSWGNVCSGGWGKQESKLVCRYLQFTGKARTRRMKVSRAPRDVKRAANAWDNIDCNGREQSFAECKGTTMHKGQVCRSGYYAFVQCQGGRVIRQAEVECDTSTSVRCGNRQKCIKHSYVCDGMSDCPWGTDEEECTVSESCPENNFDCGHANGGCISNSFRCDGENDCVDGIDESECKDYLSYYRQFRNSKIRATNFESGWRYVTPYVCAKKCREEKRFRCAAFNYNKETKECDLTSSTRSSLGITPALAPARDWDFYELRDLNCDQFRCRSGVCLSNALVCNGDNDCEGGEDELDCEDHNLYPEIIFGRLGGEDNPLLAQFEGRLEVSTDEDFGSSFGLVCDIGWGMNEANVACRQLGFRQGALQALHGNYFRRTKLPYKLNNVKCRGTERSLAECSHNGWNNATCPMDHEAGVICISNDVTLTPGPRPTTTPVVTTTRATTRPRPNPFTPAPTSPPSTGQCGVKPLVVSSRIVGGNAVEPNSWPWQAGLWVLGTFKCGGTLIAPCWVLTAAHCIDNSLHLNHKTVILGDHQTREREATEQQFRVKRIIVHPYYDADRSNRDIALIRLEEKNGKCATINEQVKPACLPTSPAQFPGGHNCWITGWGQTSYNSRVPYQNELREARVPLITTEDCRSLSRYGSQLTDDMICAGYLKGGVDTCQGDSGGPLVCGVGDIYTIWGVTSFGNGCAMAYYPGIYTKVVNFLDWINQYINE